MIDYAKIERQLVASAKASKNRFREGLSDDLALAYVFLRRGNIEKAKEVLKSFDLTAKTLGWKGGGSALPRPFHHKHLERLYWQAQKLVNGVEQPRRTGSGKPTSFHDLKGWP